MEEQNISDHLANERTFLAWIRTSIGIMAFGFVVMKFSLFVKQLTLLLGKESTKADTDHSGNAGILIVTAGIATTVLAYIRYKKTREQINTNCFKSTSIALFLVTAFIVLVSAFLVFYLLWSI